MGRGRSIFGDAQHGDGVYCAFAPQFVYNESHYKHPVITVSTPRINDLALSPQRLNIAVYMRQQRREGYCIGFSLSCVREKNDGNWKGRCRLSWKEK